MSFRAARKQAGKKPEPLDEAALYDYAVRALGRRMRTVVELKRLMRPKVEAGEKSGDARVARRHRPAQGSTRYLNDTTYAADYTRLRQENDKFGKSAASRNSRARASPQNLSPAPSRKATRTSAKKTSPASTWLASASRHPLTKRNRRESFASFSAPAFLPRPSSRSSRTGTSPTKPSLLSNRSPSTNPTTIPNRASRLAFDSALAKASTALSETGLEYAVKAASRNFCGPSYTGRQYRHVN